MSIKNLGRNLVSPKPIFSSYSQNIVNAPLISKVVKGNLLADLLPEVISWDAKVGVVVDVSKFLGSYQRSSVNESGKGVGDPWYPTQSVFTVPDDEMWFLLAFWVNTVNIDSSGLYLYSPSGYNGYVHVWAAATGYGYTFPSPLPMLAKMKLGVRLENDLGADTESLGVFVQKVKVV